MCLCIAYRPPELNTMDVQQRRVKVFSYGENNVWEDLGTGFVSKDYVEVTRGELLTITVRSENDNSIIIQSRILPQRSYKVQAGTMIIWTENESCDLALSFQEKSGCDELLMKICEVQGHLSDDGDLTDRFEDSWNPPDLPLCELSKLDEILNLIVGVAPFPQRRDTLTLLIEQENYISKLLDIFHICEDLENIEGLHHLYEIFKSLFMFNSASLLQIMFQDDIMMDVIGCLEYSPCKATPTRHREYLAKRSQFRQVIEFSDPNLLHKIHLTYRVQYIQGVILPTPSLFEENMMCALNSYILFNKTEIVNSIQKDDCFLKQLFEELCDETTAAQNEPKYQQLVALLKEICVFSQALDNGDRTKLFLKLNTYGFMAAIEGMLVCEDIVVVSVAVDILNLITDFNSGFLRDHILQTKDNTSEGNQFMNIVITLLVDGEFTDIDVQLVNLVKALVNPVNITVEAAAVKDGRASQQQMTDRVADKVFFLQYFYSHCMPHLLAPLMAQTSSDKISKDTAQNAVILSHILDILSLCVQTHACHIQTYIINKNILYRVLVLMKSVHSHLVLAAVRFCRRIIGLKDEIFNHYLISQNLLSPIVKAFMANGHRYNLVNSAILELFDYIRIENKSLLGYVVENFWSTLATVDYVDTFRNLKLKHEQEENTRESIQNKSLFGNVLVQTRYKRDPRQMDEDEEAWFDEEEEFISSTITTTPTTTTPTIPAAVNLTTPPSISITTTPPKAASPYSLTPIPTSTTTVSAFMSMLSASRTTPPSNNSNSVGNVGSVGGGTAAATNADAFSSRSLFTSTRFGGLLSSSSPSPSSSASTTVVVQQEAVVSGIKSYGSAAAEATATKVTSMPAVSAALQSLVEYDEDSDEETSTSEQELDNDQQKREAEEKTKDQEQKEKEKEKSLAQTALREYLSKREDTTAEKRFREFLMKREDIKEGSTASEGGGDTTETAAEKRFHEFLMKREDIKEGSTASEGGEGGGEGGDTTETAAEKRFREFLIKRHHATKEGVVAAAGKGGDTESPQSPAKRQKLS